MIASLSIVVAIIAAVVVAWAIDTKVHSDQAARGVTLDGRNVSGMTRDQLRTEVASVGQIWAAVPVKITSPKGNLETSLGELGVDLDQETAISAALSATDSDSALAKPYLWATSFFAPRPVPMTFVADPLGADGRLAELEAQNKVDPVEHAFAVAPDKVSVAMTQGKNGERLDLRAIIDQARVAASSGQRSITIDAKPTVVKPGFSDQEAQKLVEQANTMTKRSVSLYLSGKSLKIETKTLLTWLKIGPATNGQLDIQIDESKVMQDVPRLLGVSGTPVQQLGFTLGLDGKPFIVEGKPGMRCCTPESIQKITEALKAGQQRVDLELAVVAPDHDRAWAESLKVETRVADFTTPHPCCEPRVVNIHTISDAVRGAVVGPGETFSLNGQVGQRTKEKGYVEAPVIYEGTHDVDVGGGVSQFATTLFNAAFFAGLDIPAYQMHSQFISRYPYGREATVSWDKPDLKIKNNTPFGIMIWPTYTDTSITVSIYSSPWVKGDQTNQTREPKGPCTRVTTERTRTFLIDSHTELDRFTGLYQPADGVKC